MSGKLAVSLKPRDLLVIQVRKTSFSYYCPPGQLKGAVILSSIKSAFPLVLVTFHTVDVLLFCTRCNCKLIFKNRFYLVSANSTNLGTRFYTLKLCRLKSGLFSLFSDVITRHCFLVGGGGGTVGSQSPASRTSFSRLPYFFVPLSPDSRPLLCFSRYHVNHAV